VKRFEFGLQKAMEWRERSAERERSELQRLHDNRNRLEQEREAVADEIALSQAAYASPEVASAEDLRHLAGFLNALRTREGRLRDSAAQCQTEIGTQTGRCLAADRDHKLLVRLRDRQWNVWQYEMNRQVEADAAESCTATRAREGARLRSDTSSG
jgi:flagellar export protein FliJ